MLLLVFRYINMKMLNTRLMAKYINSFLILCLLPPKKKESYITFMCILSFFSKHNLLLWFRDICTHFYFYVFYDFRFSLVSFLCFFRHHPHPRSISKLLTEVSVLIIKMCLDFFIASSICFFLLAAALSRSAFCGVCAIGIKGLQIEWVNLRKDLLKLMIQRDT